MISKLYQSVKVVNPSLLIVHTASSHTMSLSVDHYIAQRLPTDVIRKIITQGGTIEIYGIYPEHFKLFSKKLGFGRLTNIRFKIHSFKKRYNYIRPKFYKGFKAGQLTLVICVPPGKDYLLHYGSLVKHLLLDLKIDLIRNLKLFYYPNAEKNIALWTKLNKKFIKKMDIVIIGYVESIEQEIKNRNLWQLIGSYGNEFYESRRYVSESGAIINLLGIKFSFWGSISFYITQQLCKLGAAQVIYMGKLGTLTKPRDVYTRIFAPSKFVLLNTDKPFEIKGIKNAILSKYPTLNSGSHITVPTVLEQGYIQRRLENKLDIQTIDDEIAYIAKAISDYNRQLKKSVHFGAIHIATDYLRNRHENELRTKYDLSNHRTIPAKRKKDLVIKKAANLLLKYLAI